MGKATINSHLGSGLYSITTVFDKAAALAQKTKLEAVLAKVQDRIDADPGPELVELRVLLIRKTSLEKQIAKITAASEMSRTTQAWCGDLVEDLSGTVGTVEIETDPVYGGLMIHPGYAGAAAYNAVRDGIETPFRTMHVADAMLNFALMPAIQKWEPTYRYGTVSNVDAQAGTCDLSLENSNSYIRGININAQTYFTGVPIEYMNCDAAAFEAGDSVVAKYNPYDVAGTITVIGFKDHPKPCESRHILIQLGSAWLLYDIVGRRTAYNLGEGAPSFPCAKNPTTNNWVAAHCSVDANDTLYAYIGDTVGWSYVKTERDFGPIFNDPWFFYVDNDLITDCLRNDDEWWCDAGGWGASAASAVCKEDCESATSEMNPYVAAFPAHTGETIESVWGDNPNWGFWHPVCCKVDLGPNSIPRYFVFSNSYREWFLVGWGDTMNKIIYSIGDEGNRSFIVCVEGWGETFQTFGFPFYISQEHYIESTFRFFSPFEVDELPTTIEIYDYPASSVQGQELSYWTCQVQTKHNNQDMVGVCTFSWKIHDKSGGADQVGENSPHADWYISKDIDSENIPNPWGSHLQRDENLSTIFANMVNELNAGTIGGFQYQFVDVT